MTPDNLITELDYVLQNESGDFTRPELLSYLNRALEMIYSALVIKKSEFVRTGTGSFSTIIGTQSYDLTGVDTPVTDLWVLHRVWLTGESLMKHCAEEDLYDTINAEEDSETGHRCEPQNYCLIGNTLWFKESPDAIYTVNLRYFPSFTALTLGGSMPYNDAANLPVKDMLILLAKNRLKTNDNLHFQLWQLTTQASGRIMNLREVKQKKITVHSSCYRCH
jgi:hypothetical protein